MRQCHQLFLYWQLKFGQSYHGTAGKVHALPIHYVPCMYNSLTLGILNNHSTSAQLHESIGGLDVTQALVEKLQVILNQVKQTAAEREFDLILADTNPVAGENATQSILRYDLNICAHDERQEGRCCQAWSWPWI